MNLLAHFQHLLNYDDWANREVIASLRSNERASHFAFRVMSHIIATERVWLARLQQRPNPAVWPEWTLDETDQQRAENAGQWQQFMDSLNERSLEREVEYRNTKGELFRSAAQDIVTHTIMHSAYHRGQIASDLRSSGGTPSYTDFIHAVRQGFVDEE
ncbi:MAG TPA: DinB family protein [Terriglobales bacterium]|jgi:uncharacterized damage-inducible protein DinB|nr:DinB family protein [Terriglobales bacterium]